MTIYSEEELGRALKEEQDTIDIEGDLTKKVLRIKATGKVAWAIAIGAISIAVTILISSGGTGAPVSGLVGIGAVSVLGGATSVSAVSIAVAAGGVRALNSLRRYRIVEQSGGKVVLKRR